MINTNDLRSLVKPNFKIPLFYLATDWTIILTLASVGSTFSSWWIKAFCILLIGGRQHALFALIHEGAHKHLAKSKRFNDFLASYLAAYPLFFDMHTYRQTHLKHHEHLNTDLDPDWVRKRDRKEWQFPISKAKMLLYAPYFILMWGPVELALIMVAFSGVTRRQTYTDPQARFHLVSKIFFYGSISLAATLLGIWAPILTFWLVPFFFIFPAIQRVRSIAEHFGLEWRSELASSREVIVGPVERFFFAPHGVNHHLTHHLYPAVPCYKLPKLLDKLMENEVFAAEAPISYGYLNPFKRSVFSEVTSDYRKSRPSDSRAA